MRNFSGVWVTGSTNHKSSNIVDHGNSTQHTACMAHMRAASARAQNKPAESYAPIARSLLVLGNQEKENSNSAIPWLERVLLFSSNRLFMP